MEIDGFWIDQSTINVLVDIDPEAVTGDISSTLNSLYPSYRQISCENSFKDYLTAVLKYSEAE